MFTRFKGYRTIIFNTLASLVPIFILVMEVLNTSGIQAVLPPDWLTIYTIVVTIGNIILRYVTTTPVGVSEEK